MIAVDTVVSLRLKCDRLSSLTDSRTENWFLMSSPLPQTIVIAAYIYFVTSLGPRIMENRKAFDLKGVLIVYNFSVVALSVYMIYEVSAAFPAVWLCRTCISCSAPFFRQRRLVSDGAKACEVHRMEFSLVSA